MKKPKRITTIYHLSTRIERPASTLRGRIWQRVRSKVGHPLLLFSGGNRFLYYLKSLREFQRQLNDAEVYTKCPIEQKRVEMSYTEQGLFGLEGSMKIYCQAQLLELVTWKICPCSDGVDLLIECSAHLSNIIEIFRDPLLRNIRYT